MMASATVDILDAVTQGRRIDEAEALHLFQHADLLDLAVAATAARNRHNDPARVSYVIDRNVNYTDVCNVYCSSAPSTTSRAIRAATCSAGTSSGRRPRRPRPWAAPAS